MGVLVSIFALSLGSVFADAGLPGTWVLQKLSCASGAPAGGFGENVDGAVHATTVIDAATLKTTFDVKMKFKEGYVDSAMKALNEALAVTKARPEGADKQNALNELNNTVQVVQLYAKETSCSTTEVMMYTLNGSTLTTTPTGERSSNCPGDQAPAQDSGLSRIEIKDDVMTVTALAAETDADAQCPKGDYSVTTFKRKK